MVCGFHFGALNLDLIPFHWEIMSEYPIVKGSLGGETSVLRTFRMSGKELVQETVRQRKS